MKKLLASLALLVVIAPAITLAAQFKSNEDGSAVTVAKNETATNLYIAGDTVTIDGNVSKDLVAGGNTINMNGYVQNSMISAGRNLNIKGSVGDNARVAGNNVTISGTIGGDVNVAGQNVKLEEGSSVSGDFLGVGNNITLAGRINGNVRIGAASNVTISGNVAGNVEIDNVKNLKLEDPAFIGGKLTYGSGSKASIENEGNIKGGVTFKQKNPINLNFNIKEALYWSILMKTLLVLVTLFVLVYLMPRFSHNFVNESYRNIWKNLGFGFLALVVTPLIMLVLLISLIGIPLSFALAMLYFLLLILAGIYAPLIIGSLVYKLADKKTQQHQADWKTILIGVGVVFILQLIPVVGWLALLFFFLVALGEFILTGYGLFLKQRKRA